MQHRRSAGRGTLAIVLVTLGLIAGGLLIAFLTYEIGDPEFERAFSKVNSGMSRSDVVAVLGPPDDESSEFRLSQRQGFESTYEAASKSGASQWLLWQRGVDLTFAVGLDSSERVVFTAVGGT